MDRREFFHTSVIASLAASVLGDTTLARAAGAQAAAAAPQAAAAAPRKLILDGYSRCFHWIRDVDQLAEATIEITCGGFMPSVQAYPGHIDPAKVTTDLPAFVRTMQKHGLRVKQIRGGNQTAVDPSVEALVGTMGQLGVTHYWLGTDNYDLTKPIQPQLDAIKRKVEQFVALNQKHGTTLMYHTRAGANSVGSVVWDLLSVLKDFDPKHVGFHWDTGHMAHHMSNMWELLMRAAGPYVIGMAWKDRSWAQNLGFLGEGGPYPGPQAPPAAAAGGRAGAAGGRAGGAGRGAGAAGAGAPAAGAPAGAPGAGAPPAGARGGAPAGAAGRAGGAPGRAGGAFAEDGGGAPGGPGRGRGGPGGGRGGQMPLPLAGNTFARGGGWTSPYVAMGSGLVDVFRYAAVLRDIGFDGPMELEAEYPLGGVESGADKITLPREQVIGALKRDVLTLRAAFAQSNTGLTI